MLNYTTSIAAEKSTSEVLALLRGHGVSSVSTHYDDEGKVEGIAFTHKTVHGIREFYLSVDIDGVRAVLLAEDKAGKFKSMHVKAGSLTTREHAERVAWRVIKDWLEAQLALIDIGAATLPQVFLPYLMVAPETTLYEAYVEREQGALTA
jgi:hypothetical protein